MKWERLTKGSKATVPVGIIGGKGSGWTTKEVEEDGILITPETGEEAIFLTDNFLEEKGFVLKEEVNDSLDYFQGRTITLKLIADFWEDMSFVREEK